MANLNWTELPGSLHFRNKSPVEGLQRLGLTHLFNQDRFSWRRSRFLSGIPRSLIQGNLFVEHSCIYLSRQKVVGWRRVSYDFQQGKKRKKEPAVIAWMSPVRCRLNSSIGITLYGNESISWSRSRFISSLPKCLHFSIDWWKMYDLNSSQSEMHNQSVFLKHYFLIKVTDNSPESSLRQLLLLLCQKWDPARLCLWILEKKFMVPGKWGLGIFGSIRNYFKSFELSPIFHSHDEIL